MEDGDMRFLEGKHALITGGTRGIGKAIAAALLENGASVAICGRTDAALQTALTALQPQGTVIGHRADIGDPGDVSTLFRYIEQHFPKLDILVNNAGIGIFKPTAELSVQDWQSTLNLNLSGPFYCCREALAGFRKQGRGYIINISSLAGKNAFAGGAAYNASKFGLNAFGEAMMLDHRNEGVRVTTILPGSVATNFGKGGGEDWKIAPEDIAEIVLSVLRMPERTTVSAVEIRPSKPKK
jgi:NAD(P)-dependent dehydrogenase (short-subunit alcohol dehydrogenase family)